MRIQFYPQSSEQEQCLLSEAESKGLTVSELLNNILNERYGINPGGLSKPEVFQKVEEEVQAFIQDPQNLNKEFTLNQASETMRNLEQFYQGRPTAIRAVIGKRFSSLFGSQEPFLNVKPVLLPNKKQKLSPGTKSAMYIVVAKEEVYDKL